MASKKETNEQAVWRIAMNTPGPEAMALYEVFAKILTSRNIIKPPRTRKAKEVLPPIRMKESKP